MTVRWIPSQAIIAIHAELISEHGGLIGKVNEDSLESTLARPRNIKSYSEENPDIIVIDGGDTFNYYPFEALNTAIASSYKIISPDIWV